MTRPQRILVVDDSKLILRLGRRALEKAGHVVETVSTFEDVQAALAAGGVPDLLLVDINMPEMAGDDMVRMMRQRLGVRVPVVLFSDIKEPELARRAAASGATTFISKHWGLERLVADVQRILAETQQAHGQPATTSDDETTVQTTVEPQRRPTTKRRTLEDLADRRGDAVVVASSGGGSASSRAPRVPVGPPAEGEQTSPEAEAAAAAAAAAAVAAAVAAADASTSTSTGMHTGRGRDTADAEGCRPTLSDEWDATPAAPAVPPAASASSSTSSDSVTVAARGRLLVIDDSNLIGKMVHKALTQAGYQVIVCSTFDEIQPALDAFGRPNLILVDINMPDIMGDDLVVFFRQRWSIDSPIMMFSNVSEKELEYRAKESGADGFISKRWGVQRMVEEVNTMLQNG